MVETGEASTVLVAGAVVTATGVVGAAFVAVVTANVEVTAGAVVTATAVLGVVVDTAVAASCAKLALIGKRNVCPIYK